VTVPVVEPEHDRERRQHGQRVDQRIAGGPVACGRSRSQRRARTTNRGGSTGPLAHRTGTQADTIPNRRPDQPPVPAGRGSLPVMSSIPARRARATRRLPDTPYPSDPA
jgi:hypothetical protein